MTQTDQEIVQAANDWANNHCPPELKTATGGLNPQDAQLIGEYIQANHAGTWSVHTITDAVNKLQSQLHWRSKAEVSYDSAHQKLTTEQAGIFGAWWHSSDAKNSIVRDGDFGFENGAKILSWMVGKEFSQSGFNLAVSNLVGAVGLHLAAPRQQGERRGHLDDGRGFMAKDDVNVSAVERARRDRERNEQNQPKPETNPNDPNSLEWERKANALVGNTHSDNAILARMVSSRSHYETYLMRQRYLNSKQRVGINRSAV